MPDQNIHAKNVIPADPEEDVSHHHITDAQHKTSDTNDLERSQQIFQPIAPNQSSRFDGYNQTGFDAVALASELKAQQYSALLLHRKGIDSAEQDPISPSTSLQTLNDLQASRHDLAPEHPQHMLAQESTSKKTAGWKDWLRPTSTSAFGIDFSRKSSGSLQNGIESRNILHEPEFLPPKEAESLTEGGSCDNNIDCATLLRTTEPIDSLDIKDWLCKGLPTDLRGHLWKEFACSKDVNTKAKSDTLLQTPNQDLEKQISRDVQRLGKSWAKKLELSCANDQ